VGKTSIEWTDFSVNPIRARNKATGSVGHFCEKISPGCGRCYASDWQHRFTKDGKGTGLDYLPINRDKVELFLEPNALREVLRRRKPTKWFWCDMTDMFLNGVPDQWIDQCFAVMALTPQHTHMILTKRAERMADYVGDDPIRRGWTIGKAADEFGGLPTSNGYFGPTATWTWPLRNVWLGVSAEDQQRWNERVAFLKKCPAAVRFVSAEPLLGPIDGRNILWREDTIGDPSTPGCSQTFPIPAEDDKGRPYIDWVIVGGESGSNARPMHPRWVRSLRDQCQAGGVVFFFKQWGEWFPLQQDEELRHAEWYDSKKAHVVRVALTGRVGNSVSIPLSEPGWPGEIMGRVGKKAAGRLLDGREWSEFPVTEAAHA
jgi:protein gp37